MTATRLLRRDQVIVPLHAATLGQALALMTGRLQQAGLLHDSARIESELAAGRGSGAVRVGPDIVLPHYRTDAVDHVIVALGVAPAPLAPDESDARPGPRIVALVLAPTDATTLYLQTVSNLVRALHEPAVVQGLLNAQSVDDVFAVAELRELEFRPAAIVSDVMSIAQTATPDLTVREAVDRMLRSGSRTLAVVGEKDEVLGVVTEDDVMRGLLESRGRKNAGPGSGLVHPLRVRDVMSRSVLCIAHTATLDEAASLMVNKETGEIPVVREGRLAGLVRPADLLLALYGR